MSSNDDKVTMFANRLAKVYKHNHKVAHKAGITCYRIYDKDLPEFPLIIDVYDTKVYIAEYKANHKLTEHDYEQWLQQSIVVVQQVLQVQPQHVYLKLRKRKEDRHDQYQKNDTVNEYFVVKENSLQFYINLTDYIDTGLFLDHRITRKMVYDASKHKQVLNLFCYTGSFSIYAAAGGASRVVSVDLSNTYIDWAKRNLILNGYNNKLQYSCIKADVLQYIPTIINGTYDIIIVDPPTFSNSKMMDTFFDVQKDHVTMLNQLLQKLKPGGVIYFSNNYTKFELDASNIQASLIKDITRATTPFDFEKKLKRSCYLLYN